MCASKYAQEVFPKASVRTAMSKTRTDRKQGKNKERNHQARGVKKRNLHVDAIEDEINRVEL
tara:strand:- start:33472 stop:33657 length:186 start_codon:yes stop_codon:yes gene_type:complete